MRWAPLGVQCRCTRKEGGAFRLPAGDALRPVGVRSPCHLTASDAQTFGGGEFVTTHSEADRARSRRLNPATWRRGTRAPSDRRRPPTGGCRRRAVFRGAEEGPKSRCRPCWSPGDQPVVITPNYQAADSVARSRCEAHGRRRPALERPTRVGGLRVCRRCRYRGQLRFDHLPGVRHLMGESPGAGHSCAWRGCIAGPGRAASRGRQRDRPAGRSPGDRSRPAGSAPPRRT